MIIQEGYVNFYADPSDFPTSGRSLNVADGILQVVTDGNVATFNSGASSATVDQITAIDTPTADITLLYDNGLPRIDAIDVKATGKFVYVNPTTGLDSRTRAQAMIDSTPWQTPRQVYDAATSGDGAYIAAGTYTANGVGDYPEGYHRLGGNSKSLSYIAVGDVTFKSTDVSNAQGFVSAVPNNGFVYVQGITFDGGNNILSGISFNDMTTNAWDIKLDNCSIKNFVNYGYQGAFFKIGTFTVNNCKISGQFAQAAITHGSGTALATSGNLTVNYTYNTVTNNYVGTAYGIAAIVGGAIGANTVTYNIIHNTIEITASGSSGVAIGASINTPNTDFSNNTVIINSESTSQESLGVILRSTAYKTLTDSNITSNEILFNAPAGHAVSIGDETGGLQVTSVVEKNIVIGKYYPSSTPHNISLRRNTTSVCRYNKSSDSYVGIIASKTTTADINNNLTVDCYGVDLYAKGCTAATFDKNTCVVTGKYTRRNLGVISVDSQGGVSTTATTMSNNTVLVTTDDIAKIGALVNITVNQPCTYSNNVYILPDTIPDSTVLFYVGGTEGSRAGATGYSIDQWRAATSISNGAGTVTVTNDRIIKLPLSEILNIVSNLDL